jgi:Eukaryotic protein of unknown function (DUF1764)
MSKANNKVKHDSDKSTNTETNTKDKKSGLHEIDDLFKTGKEKKREQEEMEIHEAQKRKARNKKRRQEDAAFESIINGQQLRNINEDNAKNDWVDDGLGGRHNSEGYTGRIEDGMKIFKSNVLSKPGAGTSSLCPFDCDCCYI